MRLRVVVSAALIALLAGGMTACSSSSDGSGDDTDPCIELAHSVCERPPQCGVSTGKDCLRIQLDAYSNPDLSREGCRAALEFLKDQPCSYFRK